MAHEPDDITTNVTASVKWYNSNKGFGFVQPENGSGDAFLHASVVATTGHQSLGEGDVVICDIAVGPRGPQVVAIHKVEPSSAPPREWHGPGNDAPGETIEGVVKFFDTTKGFGFILPDGGGKDIFVSARTLTRCGLEGLTADQRVRVTTRMGPKGPMAEDVTLL
ncbi:MAG: cold-shock protein [Geminicoccaceae bacterium]